MKPPARSMAFYETLSWRKPSGDQARMGHLADESDFESVSLRCAVMPKPDAEEAMIGEGGGIGVASVTRYTLKAWANSLKGLKTNQECDLSKRGRVRVVKVAIGGEFARFAMIDVESVT